MPTRNHRRYHGEGKECIRAAREQCRCGSATLVGICFSPISHILVRLNHDFLIWPNYEQTFAAIRVAMRDAMRVSSLNVPLDQTL